LPNVNKTALIYVSYPVFHVLIAFWYLLFHCVLIFSFLY